MPAESPFALEIEDPDAGRLRLTGCLHETPDSRVLIVALHGLAGSCESPYARRFASRAAEAGITCLRLNLRGADRAAPDFYHAGLTIDLESVLAAPELARFDRVVLAGFSLGGHLALRFAVERAEPRLAGVVAICSPLDLELGASALDAPRNWFYRSYLLGGMKEMADAIERRRPGAIAAPRARRLKAHTIREWDGLVVAPRWRFTSAEDYNARASVGPLLGRIAVPAWIVEAEHDPMVPADTVRPALAGVSATTEVTWTRRGGHVGFPADLDLGRRGPRGLEPQVLAWITEATAS